MKSSLFFIKFLENSNAAYFELQCNSPSGKKKIRPQVVYSTESLYSTWKFSVILTLSYLN